MEPLFKTINIYLTFLYNSKSGDYVSLFPSEVVPKYSMKSLQVPNGGVLSPAKKNLLPLFITEIDT